MLTHQLTEGEAELIDVRLRFFQSIGNWISGQ